MKVEYFEYEIVFTCVCLTDESCQVKIYGKPLECRGRRAVRSLTDRINHFDYFLNISEMRKSFDFVTESVFIFLNNI